MRDIIDGLAKLRHEFLALNIKPPAAVLLEDHDEGMKVLHQVHQMNHLVIPLGSERGGKVIEHPDGSVWMEIELFGMKIRWPAMKLAKPEGGYVWY